METSTTLLLSPRFIAIVLSLGSLFWGFLLLMIGGPIVLVFPPTAVGYLVTAGYITRAIWTPPLVARWLIWMASIATQGGWFLVMLPDLLREANPGNAPLTHAWWAFATFASFVAIFREQETIAA